MELESSTCVLCAFGAGTTLQHGERLAAALRDLCACHPPGPAAALEQRRASGGGAQAQLLPDMRFSPRDAFAAATKRCGSHPANPSPLRCLCSRLAGMSHLLNQARTRGPGGSD